MPITTIAALEAEVASSDDIVVGHAIKGGIIVEWYKLASHRIADFVNFNDEIDNQYNPGNDGGPTVTGLSNVTGVTVPLASVPNGEGTGTIEFDFSELKCRWTAPGGSAGAWVDVSEDGDFVLVDGTLATATLTITVDASAMPVDDQEDDLTLINNPGTDADVPNPAGEWLEHLDVTPA